MNVIFTCGGTAGHVNPALALAGFLRERDPKTRILFVGAERGLERDLIAHTPYPFRTVNISSFHRSLRPKELRHNLVSVRNLMHAKREADAILDEFQPDLIVGTGGYASYPIVRYGHARGIPTAVHESNAVPGLTTRLLENHCDRILVGFEDCRRYYKHKDRVVVTGTPVRGDFFTQTKAQAKEKLGVNDGRPLVVSFWGSLGAGNMNRVTAGLLYLEAAKEPFHHVHSVGSLGWQKMHEWVSGYGVDLRDHPSLDVREYIYDMADVMRAADLVICRAGASTLSELTALGVPAILVPSPNVTNHHQEKNAAVLGEHGAALQFARQKGANDSEIKELEANMKRLTEISQKCLGKSLHESPGSGSAGGCGYGLINFLGAKRVSGFELFAEYANLDKFVKECNVLVTGEGKFDKTDSQGKGPYLLAKMAEKHKKHIWILCGTSDVSEKDLEEMKLSDVKIGEIAKIAPNIIEANNRAAKFLAAIARDFALEML